MKWFYKLALISLVIMMVFLAGCTNNEKAIATAVANGDTAKVQSLLDKGVNPNVKTDDGKSLLMLASYTGHTDIAKLLIDKGADVNAKDQSGKTALMYAAEKGNIEVAKLLLQNGADLNAVDNDGKTALQIAQDNKQTAMADLLSNWGKPAAAAAPASTTEASSSNPAAEAPATTTAPTAETPASAPVQGKAASVDKQLSSIFFDFDKSEIRDDQTKALADNLAILKSNPDLYVILGAHADELGSRDYNIDLSARRAATVKKYLTQAGLAADHFVVYAYGKDHPLKKGHDEASRSYNRRVDILMWDTRLSGDQVLAETIK